MFNKVVKKSTIKQTFKTNILNENQSQTINEGVMNDIITGTTVPRTRYTTKGLMGSLLSKQTFKKIKPISVPLRYSTFPKNGYSPFRWKPKSRSRRVSPGQGEWNSFPH
uniref:Uncharacterized protein n=1 Tax=Heterorhabditis bacteriophora TaxID=37862 RepID=A0A1I7WY18_HETBA